MLGGLKAFLRVCGAVLVIQQPLHMVFKHKGVSTRSKLINAVCSFGAIAMVKITWNVFFFVQLAVHTWSLRRITFVPSDETGYWLSRLYDLDNDTAFLKVYGSFFVYPVLPLLCYVLLYATLATYLYMAISEPGDARKGKTKEYLRNTGLAIDCYVCGLIDQKDIHHVDGKCVPGFHMIDRDFFNVVGAYNHLAYVFCVSLHLLSLVCVQWLQLSYLIFCYKEIARMLANIGVASKTTYNIMSMVLPVNFATIQYIIAACRIYPLISMCVCELWLYPYFGFTAAGLRRWTTIRRHLILKENYLLERVEPYEVTEEDKELYLQDYRDIRVLRSVMNHIVSKKLESYEPGDRVYIQFASGRPEEYVVLKVKDAVRVTSQWKFGRGYRQYWKDLVGAFRFGIRDAQYGNYAQMDQAPRHTNKIE